MEQAQKEDLELCKHENTINKCHECDVELNKKGYIKCHRRFRYILREDKDGTRIILPFKQAFLKKDNMTEMKLDYTKPNGEKEPFDFMWVHPADYSETRFSQQTTQPYKGSEHLEIAEEPAQVGTASVVMLSTIDGKLNKVDCNNSLDGFLAEYTSDDDLPKLREALKETHGYQLHPAVKKIETAKMKAKQDLEL